MEEVVFLFLYHKVDEVTYRHFELLQKLHPRDQIVPVAYELKGNPVLPGTVDVGLDWDYGWPIFSTWHEIDKIYLRWFLRPNRPAARRYVFFEYDILPKCTAEAFYGPTWNSDCAAVSVQLPETDHSWHWWRQSNSLDLKHFASRCGVSPLAGTLWSHNSLQAIARRPALGSCFCELRMGTLLRSRGFTPAVIPNASATMSWRASEMTVSDAKTWFHPVKV